METVIHTGHGSGSVAQEPAGGSTGVSFDWGFAISLAVTGVASLLGLPLGLALSPPLAVGSLVLAVLMWVQGEALRRGNGTARRIQIGLHALLVVYGLVVAAQTVQALAVGDLTRLPSSLIALVLTLGVSPAEIWLLMQSGSRRWYGAVEPAAALERHSGTWLLRVLAWAVVGGVLNAVLP